MALERKQAQGMFQVFIDYSIATSRSICTPKMASSPCLVRLETAEGRQTHARRCTPTQGERAWAPGNRRGCGTRSPSRTQPPLTPSRWTAASSTGCCRSWTPLPGTPNSTGEPGGHTNLGPSSGAPQVIFNFVLIPWCAPLACCRIIYSVAHSSLASAEACAVK